jgi:uncharacterized membrane protein YedE/YeeE
MAAIASVPVNLLSANGKLGVCPFGNTISTGSGNTPVHNAVYAALVAAVAQAPVVQP